MNNEMKKINIETWHNLESVVYLLLAHQADGNHVYCEFNGHRLESDNITMDSAYIEVTGKTKEEFEDEQKRMRQQWEEEEKEEKAREQRYQEIVLERTNGEPQEITQEKVVEGLKFIAEHQDMEQEDLLIALLDLGCTFSLDDVKKEVERTNATGSLFDGMRNGEMVAGASVICNVRDSEFGRSYADDRFLSLDDDISIYHYVRKVTGDENYTKENIENGTLDKGRSM